MTVHPRRSVRALEAYALEPSGGLNLSNNASLFPPNPGVEKALAALDADALRDYPTLYGDELCERLADRHGVAPEHIVTGNGSNDLIDLLVRTFTEEGSGVAYHPPSFSMIPIWAACNGADPVPVPLDDDFALDVEGMVAADARIAFICRPNNPTGNAFALDDVRAIAERFDGLVVVDEAYITFTDEPSAQVLLEEHGNVALLRSLSKDAGLAGIRLGYAVLPVPLADHLRKVRGPFRVSRITEAIALAALGNLDHVEAIAATVRNERDRVAGRLRELGLDPRPSEANFLLIDTPWSGGDLAARLARDDILVRAFSDERLATMVRATIAPPADNDRFLAALATIVEEGGP